MRTPAAQFAHTRNAQRAIPNHPASGLANPLRHELETRAKLAEFAFGNECPPDFGTIDFVLAPAKKRDTGVPQCQFAANQ
jgi:hypothetical protein